MPEPILALSKAASWAKMPESAVPGAAPTSDTLTAVPPSTSEDVASSPKTPVSETILNPDRLQALLACDSNVLSYNPESFMMIFRLRGRNLPTIMPPLLLLLIWGAAWGVALSRVEPMRVLLIPLDELISPLLTPVSFLLVFRLGRAAVRFWDARTAAGKMVEVCRTLGSTTAVSCAGSPALQEDFARWICIFPIAVKNFMRPVKRKHWESTARRNKQRFEFGLLLPDADAEDLLQPEAYGPILVLNRLRQLAYRAATELDTEPHLRAMVYNRLNVQLDTLTGTWGAMERINSTPLPFVYVVHLRTFLVLYLLLWQPGALALYGWPALPALFATGWALLGIEAASVECERPFRWEANHLPLGKMCVVVARNIGQTLRNARSGVTGEAGVESMRQVRSNLPAVIDSAAI